MFLRMMLFLILSYSIGGLLQAEDVDLPTRDFDWVLVYYMSYDNNLDVFTSEILNHLQEGVRSERVAVVVQSDSRSRTGMKRITVRFNDGKIERQEMRLRSDDSASAAELEKLFEWVGSNFESNKYAVVFLDHGGSLNHMCLDEHTGREDEEEAEDWLKAHEAARVLASFHNAVGGRLQLLFHQQCGRGTIENLYSFADSAKFLLSSPFVVGAPNTYYTPVLRTLSRYPETDGVGLAEKIMTEDEHYISYTLVSTKALKTLPERVSELNRLFKGYETSADRRRLFETFRSGSERNFDIESVLRSLDSVKFQEIQSGVQDFTLWYKTSLIVRHSFGPQSDSEHQRSSGLSMFIAASDEDLGQYSILPFYQVPEMKEFSQRISRACRQSVND